MVSEIRGEGVALGESSMRHDARRRASWRINAGTFFEKDLTGFGRAMNSPQRRRGEWDLRLGTAGDLRCTMYDVRLTIGGTKTPAGVDTGDPGNDDLGFTIGRP